MAEAALERWRDRCIKAIETGNGIPTVGHLWWRRVDPAAERSVAHAIELSDGTSSSVLESTLVHGRFAALAMRMPGRAKGYEAALLWLREELAREGGDRGCIGLCQAAGFEGVVTELEVRK